jgi:phosphomannomutase
MYFELDGTFPNHIANPLIPENLVDLQAAIKEQKADVGLAFDGDGDRAVMIDENGEALSGTVMTAMLASYFLDKHPGSTIILNAICGRAAKEAVESKGGKAVRSRVGHSYIKSDMRTQDAVFAGEHSGHYYFRDNFMADSGLLAEVIGMYIVSTSGKKLSELAAPYRKAYATINEMNFEVADKQAAIAAVKAAFADGEQDELDGLTVNYPNSWFNVRPSNTEPLLRLNAEAKSRSELDSLVSKVIAVLEK